MSYSRFSVQNTVTRALMAAVFIAAALTFQTQKSHAEETMRAAVLKFGTVSWLMDVIKHHKLDKKENFNLELVTLIGPQAAQVALLSGNADTSVTDWFWVLHQRSLGANFTFVPYSVALGSLIVPADSPIKTIADLKGKRIGIAGSPIDKSWLLLRAYSKKTGSGDLAESAKLIFAAPPLLNEQLRAGRVDAVLNNWNLTASLEAEGYRRIASVAELMKEFDIPTPLPLLGFVVSEKFAAAKPKVLQGFANAMQNAQKLLLTSDAEWDRIRPLTQAGSDAEFKVLRERYREGLLHTWSERDRKAAGRLFDLMAETGGEQLTGKGVKFDPGIFWNGLVF
ncbi:MAG: ABC transporter substrate-binding protein [Hyphomicrobiales bacterium]|nr:ABC transporter substrate-binding protein [Hyphomicrobiales bacterium]